MLQDNIDSEASARAAADASLTTRVGDEGSARAAADASLQTRLAAEEAAAVSGFTAAGIARNSGDASLATSISNEATIRGNADSSLTTRLGAEEAARASAVTSLRAALDVDLSGKANLAGGNDFSGDQNVNGDIIVEIDHKVKAGEFLTYSDRNLKTNIQPMNDTLDKVMQLETVTYDVKRTGRQEIGFIAQEVAKVLPEVCAIDAGGEGRAIDYGRMTALLAGAVKTQQVQIEELKAVLAKLQK